jgi:diaminopimelate decarboxylase
MNVVTVQQSKQMKYVRAQFGQTITPCFVTDEQKKKKKIKKVRKALPF